MAEGPSLQPAAKRRRVGELLAPPPRILTHTGGLTKGSLDEGQMDGSVYLFLSLVLPEFKEEKHKGVLFFSLSGRNIEYTMNFINT